MASSVVGGVAGSVAGLPGSSISTDDYSSGGMRAPSSTNQPLSSSAFQVQLIHLNVSKDVHYYLMVSFKSIIDKFVKNSNLEF